MFNDPLFLFIYKCVYLFLGCLSASKNTHPLLVFWGLYNVKVKHYNIYLCYTLFEMYHSADCGCWCFRNVNSWIYLQYYKQFTNIYLLSSVFKCLSMLFCNKPISITTCMAISVCNQSYGKTVSLIKVSFIFPPLIYHRSSHLYFSISKQASIIDAALIYLWA